MSYRPTPISSSGSVKIRLSGGVGRLHQENVRRLKFRLPDKWNQILPTTSIARQIAVVDAADIVNAFDVFNTSPARSLRNWHQAWRQAWQIFNFPISLNFHLSPNKPTINANVFHKQVTKTNSSLKSIKFTTTYLNNNEIKHFKFLKLSFDIYSKAYIKI